MPKSYKFSVEQILELEQAKKKNKNKNVDKRLQVLLLKGQKKKNAEVAIITSYNSRYVSELVSKYFNKGILGIVGEKRRRRGNLTWNEEEALLAQFRQTAETGQVITIAEIKASYDAKLGRESAKSIIYKMLHRHGWRKVMPRSRHPKKASDEVIEASKKLTLVCKN